jgi:hypothetical protein
MGLLLAFFTIVALCAGLAQAAPVRLNINMSETVYQNVTYGQDFFTTNSMVETQTYCIIRGIINVTNPEAETVSDVYLSFVNTDEMMTPFRHLAGRNVTQIQGTVPGQTYVVHINELRANDFSTFNYTINCSAVAPPLDIQTNYSNAETGILTKVLAGHNWTVNQTVSNQLAIGQPITDINITIEAQSVMWNSSVDNFTLLAISPLGDYLNLHGNGTSTESWWWQVSGGTLPAASSEYLTYVVRAPDAVPTSNTYMALKETLRYRVGYLASNLTLMNSTSIADIEFSLDKRIVRPASGNNNTNATWEVNSVVNVTFPINYNLTRVSLWVTSTLDPTDTVAGLSRTYTPNARINESNPWTNSPNWQFNYTDASNNISARPPIVWMRPYFTIMNAYGQIISMNVTQNGDDLYMKYIYVVNGYWLQVDKNVTSVADNQYNITTVVQNVGNAPTPSGLVVTVYDFVPVEFNITAGPAPGYDAVQSVTGAGFNGTAYRWTIPSRVSDAPWGDQNASLYPVPAANSTWTVSYLVNGTGDYKVSDLYIVGLDPRKVDGAGTHEGITLVSGIQSKSRELFYIAVVVFLVVINVVNFVMTRKISKKLEDGK